DPAFAPGTICNLIARPRTPLAAAIINRFASALTDISISVAEAAIEMISWLPSTFHSPPSSMEQRMLCPALESAARTATRTCPTSVVCGSGLLTDVGCAVTAGAADPITIGAELVAADVGRAGEELFSDENSDRGVRLRAE